ncbi:hypothetical protein Cni_G08409 [Canna indica]|uniref:Uncharacterized protein n=1 Tax=Canna indica TaxID=4628 RepID=A0AAQ3K0X0_9LILI|nr:hypothetical protein Cni_G08409 [Canna indica]
MGKQNNDAIVLCSSIALLQERFRRLQRIKEMREERQIMQMFAEAEQPPIMQMFAEAEPPKWFYHHALVHPSRPPCGSPSLQSEYHVNCAEFQSFETSLSLGLWSGNASMHAAKISNEIEVDTSLHL